MTHADVPPPRHPLRAAAGAALERALNHALELDPGTRESLAGLAGRSVQLQLNAPPLAFNVRVDGDALRVEPPRDADLRIASTPSALLAMALRGSHVGGAGGGKVDIAGDADLAQHLQRLLRDYAPDSEAQLTRHFGDVAGVAMARAGREVFAGARRFAHDFSEDGADWLRDEAQVTPSRAEVDPWLDGVDALRERVDRLEARLKRREAAR